MGTEDREGATGQSATGQSATGQSATGKSATGQETELDAATALGILEAAEKRARRELTVSHPAMLTAWGVIYLVAFGVLWLSVRGQRPFQGPTPAATSTVGIFVLVALTITAGIIGRASTGVGGRAAAQRSMYYIALPIGFAGVFVLEAALDHGGASRAVVALMGASGPVLVTGIAYMVSSAIDLTWPIFGLGAWLVATAAGGAFAGPVGVWAVEGLSGGLAFLLAAVTVSRWPVRT
jgi:hypothetical protein